MELQSVPKRSEAFWSIKCTHAIFGSCKSEAFDALEDLIEEAAKNVTRKVDLARLQPLLDELKTKATS